MGERTVSVIVPAYNEEKKIAKCLESLLAQTTKPLEIIVIDDGSADKTAEVARGFGVKVISIPHGGMSRALNAGLDATRGDFVLRIEGDLWVEPEYIEKCLGAVARGFDGCDNLMGYYRTDTLIEAVLNSERVLSVLKMREKKPECFWAVFFRRNETRYDENRIWNKDNDFGVRHGGKFCWCDALHFHHEDRTLKEYVQHKIRYWQYRTGIMVLPVELVRGTFRYLFNGCKIKYDSRGLIDGKNLG
jgi:glycosyltransferase involved in cell wall biosynthesis